jgi:hypothetical protein
MECRHILVLWVVLMPMLLACSIWLGTFGSGAGTGMEKATTRVRLATPVGQLTAPIAFGVADHGILTLTVRAARTAIVEARQVIGALAVVYGLLGN